MRHRKHSNQLGVKKEHRKALLANLAVALIENGRITTTLKKAKALCPFVEKIVTLAKNGSLHARRLAIARVRAAQAVHLLFDEKAEEFAERPGGYTRIYKIGPRRGDAAEMAVIELIDAADEGYGRKGRRPRAAAKAAAPAAAEAANGREADREAAAETGSEGPSEPEAPAPDKEERPADEPPKDKPAE